MKDDSTIYVGLGSHKDSNVAAYSVGLGEAQVQVLDDVGTRDRDLLPNCG